MKDNMYEFLNNMKIDEPDELMEVTQEEKDRIKNDLGGKIMKPKKSKKYLKTISIAAALVLSFLAFTKPGQVIYGNMVDLYHKMVNPIGTYALDSEGVKDGITVVDKAVTDKGIEIKVEDALLDEDTIYINAFYKVVDESIAKNFDDDASLVVFPTFTNFTINGKEVGVSGGTVQSTFVDNRSVQEYQFYQLDDMDDKVKDGDTISLTADKVRVFDYNKMNWENMGTLSEKEAEDLTLSLPGNWKITFTIKDGTPQMKTAKVDLSQEKIQFQDQTLHLDTFRLNPYRSTITMKYDDSAGMVARKMIFIGKDRKGIEYRFEAGAPGSGIGQKEAIFQFVQENEKDLLAQDTLTIQGYYDQSNDPEQKDYIPVGEPITITIK
ncbi:MAG: DUF4179 domain-containing protein [Tissierellia bacterium]|nr:DUF4179 domain-containing protein [Tissierellia bacterium]